MSQNIPICEKSLGPTNLLTMRLGYFSDGFGGDSAPTVSVTGI